MVISIVVYPFPLLHTVAIIFGPQYPKMSCPKASRLFQDLAHSQQQEATFF